MLAGIFFRKYTNVFICLLQLVAVLMKMYKEGENNNTKQKQQRKNLPTNNKKKKNQKKKKKKEKKYCFAPI